MFKIILFQTENSINNDHWTSICIKLILLNKNVYTIKTAKRNFPQSIPSLSAGDWCAQQKHALLNGEIIESALRAKIYSEKIPGNTIKSCRKSQRKTKLRQKSYKNTTDSNVMKLILTNQRQLKSETKVKKIGLSKEEKKRQQFWFFFFNLYFALFNGCV